MATQSSQLITNLTYIYNTKLQLKEALETQSDVFSYYPSYVQALKPSGTTYITTNGEHSVSSYAVAYVTVEGGGEIPAGYTYVSGTLSITENDDYDVSSYAYVTVDVEGGGGDPYNDAYDINGVIDNDLVGEEIEYYMSILSDNYEALPWSEYTLVWDENNQIDGNDVIVHVIATATENPLSEFDDYLEDLYSSEAIYPILENVIVTESEDPSWDGYDYLVEGTLKYMNLQSLTNTIETIEENGFYVVNGQTAFNVDIEGGEGGDGITPEGTINISQNGTTDVTTYAYAYVSVPQTGITLDGRTAYLFPPHNSNIDISSFRPSYVFSFGLYDECDTTTEHEDIFIAEIFYYDNQLAEPEFRNLSYLDSVHNLSSSWFKGLDNNEGWTQVSFNYYGNDNIYLRTTIYQGVYSSNSQATASWMRPAKYGGERWDYGGMFTDQDDPMIFSISPGYNILRFYVGNYDPNEDSGEMTRLFSGAYDISDTVITDSEFEELLEE